ncbi:hypothetical protein BDW_13940 [Bdellovibrio bacteriovorus W]|nr:hypothetical protein BDW_13940 [Bdellovibrio bacteriovorus W]
MYLHKLVINTNKGVLREVPFKKGLNLIVDRTTSTKRNESGNNVGKTTFLRIIDFCLGGDKDPIYTDREFKKKNQSIYDFLFNNEVNFDLFVETKKGTIHRINRPIDGKASIDGVPMTSEKKFTEQLMLLMFGCNVGKPSFGQLMNKFIRIENDQIENALYFLFSMSDRSDYEALFMFLFGFRDTGLLAKKRVQIDKIKKLRKNLESFTVSTNDLEQQIHLINTDLQKLEEEKTNLNIFKNAEEDLSELRVVQSNIVGIKTELSKLNVRLAVGKEALAQLYSSKSKVNTDTIKAIYEQAKTNVAGLSKKFEDVVNFHNQMVDSKTKFIEGSLKTTEDLLADLRHKLSGLANAEAGLLKRVENKGLLGEYDNVNAKLQEKSREKGQKEGLLESLTAFNTSLQTAAVELAKINDSLFEFDKAFKDNLKKFNEYFSDFSEKLYGDRYYVSVTRVPNETTENYLLDIGNLKENMGTGKKKAQISALDLAYLKYSQESELRLPLFVVHDQLETVFETQIGTLFDLANSVSGQFIVAVLSDKLHLMDPKVVEANTILTLSQNDKLFKIP